MDRNFYVMCLSSVVWRKVMASEDKTQKIQRPKSTIKSRFLQRYGKRVFRDLNLYRISGNDAINFAKSEMRTLVTNVLLPLTGMTETISDAPIQKEELTDLIKVLENALSKTY